jgi:hypothetical protein
MNTANQAAPYRVRAHNASTQSENRMHSDDVARQFGFRGGLVPGVAVFAHMTQPLVARYGEAWLARGTSDVRFDKPAYEGELLSISMADGTDGTHTLTCANADGAELARMTATMPATATTPDARGGLAPAPPQSERLTVTWDLMEIGRPFPALAWTPSREDNLVWCRDCSDDLPLYREGSAPLLHPGFILRQANHVLRTRFILPAWIHAASRITFFEALRVGPAYEVRAIPDEKWNRKGHEFVRLYVAIRCGQRTVAEVSHTAIFRPRKQTP